MQTADVIVLGAGAAGLLCAREAGLRGRRVLLLDHNERAGRKILISGGGRCNFTNRHTSSENFLSENPHFARSALARYPPEEFVALVARHGIAFHEKTLGQLFCDGSAQAIVTMLERECAEAGVRTLLSVAVHAVERREDGFALATSAGPIRAAKLVIATGGPSIPKMGATGFGYEIARQFGMGVVAPRPALVPLVFGEADRAAWCDLAGVSAEVVAEAGTARERGNFREKLLLTHRGLSGPAVLQISSFWREGSAISVDLAPGREIFGPLLARPDRRDASTALPLLREVLPARWAERWLARNATGWSNRAIEEMERRLHAWTLEPAGTEGYAKAEVTAGGVDTRALDARTMESRSVPGLFFIGEVVDVTGWLGGYNFQWAWASGAAAGRAV